MPFTQPSKKKKTFEGPEGKESPTSYHIDFWKLPPWNNIKESLVRGERWKGSLLGLGKRQARGREWHRDQNHQEGKTDKS